MLRKGVLQKYNSNKQKKIRLQIRVKKHRISKGVKLLKELLLRTKQEDSTFYGFSEFSLFSPVKKNLIRFLKPQFLKHYVHIGLQRRQIHQGTKSQLLGFAGELAVIDPDLLVYNYRRLFKFMLSFFLKNYRFCFIAHRLAPYFSGSTLFFKYHMVFDYWIPGSVSNFKTLSKQRVRKKNFFLKRFPQVLVGIKLDNPKIYSVSKEARKAGVPMFCFLDTDLDVSFFNYFFVLNLHSLTSFRFCFFLISSLLKRAILVKKVRFLKDRKKAKCS